MVKNYLEDFKLEDYLLPHFRIIILKHKYTEEEEEEE